MHISEIYKSIYRYWDDTTPLYGDCGKLCGKACCESDETDEDETGMYLFPGEEKLFKEDKNFRVVSSDFSYGDGKIADIAICKGPCQRDLRPLSCRIFPLIPYYKNGKLTVIQDPRAKHMCPLAQKKALSYLDPAFIRKTEQTFRLLLRFSEVRSFLMGLTEILDDCLKFDPTEDLI
ncbi:MAG: hypothetical protein IJC78_05480 [Clostridia bacterium]|nr:hypothetical protein [Clostridia bacterium]